MSMIRYRLLLFAAKVPSSIHPTLPTATITQTQPIRTPPTPTIVPTPTATPTIPTPTPSPHVAPAFLRPVGAAPIGQPTINFAAATQTSSTTPHTTVTPGATIPTPTTIVPTPPAAHGASITTPPGTATPIPQATVVQPSTTTTTTPTAPTVGVVHPTPTAATVPPTTHTTTVSSAPPTTPVAPVAPPIVSAVPTFLRPAPTPLLVRLQNWQYFKHWPNIGYIISATGTMVSDILWLRSIIILSNLFGIAVNYSFKPPFMIGIRWNFFFILANLIQIARILNDRRDVELTEEEQQLYDALFSDTFSRQEYKKLLGEATWQDLPPGKSLMVQGEEISQIHLISKGVCIVEQDRLTLLSPEEVEARRKRGELTQLQSKVVAGQTILITSGGGAGGGDAMTITTGQSGSRGVNDSSSATETGGTSPPSVTRTIALSLLQGGISWFDRFRRVTSRDAEEIDSATTKMGGKWENVGVPGSTISVGTESLPHHASNSMAHHTTSSSSTSTSTTQPPQAAHADTTSTLHAPAPLPPSSIHLTIPTPQLTTSDSATSTSNDGSAPTTASSSAPSPSLPDVVILPASPHGQIGLPSSSSLSTGGGGGANDSSSSMSVAPDSHHLLNVHVDSTHAPTPASSGMETKTAGTTDTTVNSNVSKDVNPSSTTVTSSPSSHPMIDREVIPSGSGFGDGFSDLLHEDSTSTTDAFLEEDEEQIMPGVKEKQLSAKRIELENRANDKKDTKDTSSVAPADRDFSSALSPITNEDVLRSWREDRAARRATRLAELERKRAEEAAEKEKKRLLSRSALERQFGQSSQSSSSSTATGESNKDKDSAVSVSSSSSSPASTTNEQLQAAIQANQDPLAISPDTPVFEKHTSTVGYIRELRLIGEMSMVSPGGAGTADYSVAPVSVTTKEPTRVLTWEKGALQRLFFRLPSLAVGWYAVVSTDLVNRLKQQRAMSHQNGYRALLMGVLSDGSVSENQKNVCTQYRAEHDISQAQHEQALGELQWTLQDFERGTKRTSWLEWFKKQPRNNSNQ